MFNITQIQTALRGLVGYIQQSGDDLPELDELNLRSDSGLTFDGASGLINLRNIVSCINDQLVLTDDDDFNAYITAFNDQSVSKLLHAVTGRMQLGGRKDLIDARPLYTEPPLFDRDSVAPTGVSQVGYWLTVPRGVVCEVELIDVEAKQTGELDVTAYNITTRKKVNSAPLSCDAVADTVETTVAGWRLYGGEYFIGVAAGDVATLQLQNRASEYYEPLRAVYAVPAYSLQDWPFGEKELREYASDTWGMNLHLTTYKDFTDKVKRARNMFARAVQLQVACDWLDIYATSHRSNMDERLTKQAAIELNGIEHFEMIPGKAGLLEQLRLEIESLTNKLIQEPFISVVSCT
jgi:hypothetical protein